jgi:hypothetical protein
MLTAPTFEWVTVQKAAAMSGYTDVALRQKCTKGHLQQGVHWKRGLDNRVLINVKAFNHFLNKQ